MGEERDKMGKIKIPQNVEEKMKRILDTPEEVFVLKKNEGYLIDAVPRSGIKVSKFIFTVRKEVKKMSKNNEADGNMFDVLTDPDIVKDWKEAFEPTKEGEKNISLERPDPEAIIASQPPVVQEEDPPLQEYTGLCSRCTRPQKGLCPCGNNTGVNFDPKNVNIELAVRPFDQPNELVSG